MISSEDGTEGDSLRCCRVGNVEGLMGESERADPRLTAVVVMSRVLDKRHGSRPSKITSECQQQESGLSSEEEKSGDKLKGLKGEIERTDPRATAVVDMSIVLDKSPRSLPSQRTAEYGKEQDSGLKK
jgi:hypothetical protein